jgi:two-component system cell cycle response regulator
MSSLKEPFLVLVVDDSPVARKLVEHALPPHDHKLLFAKTGLEALDLFSKQRPALVITDWLMPDLSGMELCQRIRAEFRGTYAYIILLTGVSEKSQLVKALQAGADDYLTKPFHPDELLARAGVGRRMVELHREIEAKNRQLEQMTLTDELTGLPNRRGIKDWAKRQISGAERHGFSLWVVIADLDHFKSVNDTYGHEAGDTVLKTFAEILQSHTRQCDMCARIGGEEFVIVLTHVDQEGVELAINRIRERFCAHKFVFGNRGVVVTASFGITGIRLGESRDIDRLMAQADKALYGAKRLGRNRVELADIAVC